MPKKSTLTKDEQRMAKVVANDPALLKEVLKIVRGQGKADKRFDINLAEGKLSEKVVRDLLSGKSQIEVKRDYAVSRTGNILVEHGHNGGTSQSGITTTEAEWYAVVLDGDEYEGEVVVFIATDRLKRVVRNFGKDNPFSGRRGYSNFKLIRSDHLLSTNTDITQQWKRKRRASSQTEDGSSEKPSKPSATRKR